MVHVRALLVLALAFLVVGCRGLGPLPVPRPLSEGPGALDLPALWQRVGAAVPPLVPPESAFTSTMRMVWGEVLAKRKAQRAATACRNHVPPGYELLDGVAVAGAAPLHAYLHRGRADRPLIFLLHGLFDNKNAGYLRRTADLLTGEGFGVVIPDLRWHGCLLSDEWLPGLGTAEAQDLAAWAKHLELEMPGRAFGLLGFSLGGLDVIHALALPQAAETFRAGGIAISPPAELSRTLAALDRESKIKDRGLLRLLDRGFQSYMRLRIADQKIPERVGRDQPFRTMLEHVLAARYSALGITREQLFSFTDPAERIASAKRPLLILASQNDPFFGELAAAALTRAAIHNPWVKTIETSYGGHIGQPGLYPQWTADLITRFFALAVRVAPEGLSPAQSEEKAPKPGELQSLLDQLRSDVGAPGAILGVAVGDQSPFVVASGLADRETGTAMSAEQPYFLGSIAKVYTATTVLRLAEEGRLSLDDPLARFLPAFPRGSEITLRHLLAQESGLKDFYLYLYLRPDRDEMVRLVTKRWTEAELLELAGRFGHHFDPGTDWDYSNANYYLLGVVIERASGLPLTEAYRRYLYQPLGLERTWIAWHEDARGEVPTGYMGPLKEWKHSAMFGKLGATTRLDQSSVDWGSGGVAAPARENLRFLAALLGGKVLTADSLAAMRRFRETPALGVADPQVPSAAKPDGYGLGLVRMERPGFTLVGHGGLFTGHTAGVWQVEGCDVALALYFNRGFVNQRAVLDRLLPVVTRKPDGSSQCGEGRPPTSSTP